MPRVVEFIESRVAVIRGLEARNWELVFNGCRVSIWGDEKAQR